MNLGRVDVVKGAKDLGTHSNDTEHAVGDHA